VLQVHSIEPSFLELSATRLIDLECANEASAHGRAAQVDRINTRVESGDGVCNQRLKLQYDETRIQTLLPISTSTATLRRAAVLLPPRSLLVLTGEARFSWLHYIPHRKRDPVVRRCRLNR